jgi:hypothetical protein
VNEDKQEIGESPFRKARRIPVANFRLIRVTSPENSGTSERMTFLVADKNEMGKPKLLDEVRRMLRFEHDSKRANISLLSSVR